MEFVLIPKGTYTMGSPKDEKGRNKDEEQREVEIVGSFYLGAHEVTVEQYRLFVDANPYKPIDEDLGHWRTPGFMQLGNHPVVNVSFYEANRFCKWLSDKELRKYRLPYEEEWEYACRAGTTTAFWNGDSEEEVSKIGNIEGSNDGFLHTSPVGHYGPNPWGLFDMHGNVCEWCENEFESPSIAPGIPKMELRTFRGGGWSWPPLLCRSADRADRVVPAFIEDYIGFRIVLIPLAE